MDENIKKFKEAIFRLVSGFEITMGVFVDGVSFAHNTIAMEGNVDLKRVDISFKVPRE